MKFVLKPNPTETDIERAIRYIESLGMIPFMCEDGRTILGLCDGSPTVPPDALESLHGVESITPLVRPFPLVSREVREYDTVVEVRGIQIGGGHLAMIAGPCSIEGEAIFMEIAERVYEAGANILRGGAFKPRTSPYSFQGLGKDGLKILQAAGEHFDMATVTEVMDPRQVELVENYADMLQVGARNMQNFDLLKEVGRTRKPVLLKRGLSATVKDLLMSAEYVLWQGNGRVILCERGVRSFEDSTRNMLDLAAVPNVKSQSHLPIIVDPSHATGRRDLIAPMALAALSAGADGVHVEVHSCPDKALSDGPQALLPRQYARLMDGLRCLAEFHKLTIDSGLTLSESTPSIHAIEIS
jgi:3-deoxy-7-phosphoheptulonate synthase